MKILWEREEDQIDSELESSLDNQKMSTINAFGFRKTSPGSSKVAIKPQMDRITRLPDEILLNILTFLPSKQAVGTSILSRRWSSLWTLLPVLDLDSHDDDFGIPPSENFVDNFLKLNNSPRISKFRVQIQYLDRDYLRSINRWIQFLISRNVVELDLRMNFVRDINTCFRLLPIESLEILKLYSNFGLHMPISGCCFPNLRILHLSIQKSRLYEELVAKLFPNLPVLEELCLSVTRCSSELRTSALTKEKTFNIVAHALRTFSMSIDYFGESHPVDVKIVIDAPLLEKVCLDDEYISFYSFNNRTCLLEAQVSVWNLASVEDYADGYFNAPINVSRSMELLREVSNSKSLSLSGTAVLALVFSPQNNLPAFPFLTKLVLFIPYASAWKLLLPLLANAPNLGVLIITEYNLVEEFMLANLIKAFQSCTPDVLPTCLLLHLEEIEIRGVVKEEIKELEYIVENAKVLKKLTVNSVGSWCLAKRASS